MTTIAQVVLAAIPGADKDTIDHILLGRTPYPVGRISAQSLFKAASGWRRAAEHKLRLCDHCHNLALAGHWECQSCRDALIRASEAA